MTVLRVGQVYKDRRVLPSSVFLITRVWIRKYPDGSEGERVTGVFTTGEGFIDMNRDLDAEAFRKLCPYLIFQPRFTLREMEDSKNHFLKEV